jgi:hypothetical protein
MILLAFLGQLGSVTNCKQLALKFPRTREECEVVAETFCNCSMEDAIVNCVGAVDGYLLCIDVPSKEQAGNVRNYFSGHYKRYGINVQAVCDGDGIFSYLALSAPGSANDRVANKENIGGIEGSSLSAKIENLAPIYAVIGDAAYKSTEHLVSMYYGGNRYDELQDNFNFFASQCRISIERAFGMIYFEMGNTTPTPQAKVMQCKVCCHGYCNITQLLPKRTAE